MKKAKQENKQKTETATKQNVINLFEKFSIDQLRTHYNLVKNSKSSLNILENNRTSIIPTLNYTRMRSTDNEKRSSVVVMGNVKKIKTEITRFINVNETQGPFLFIHGESGVGKTRAIHEMIRDLTAWKSNHRIFYFHAPAIGDVYPVFQALMYGVGLVIERRRNKFQMAKSIETVFRDSELPIVIIDDAQNLLLLGSKMLMVMETLKQLTESTDVKFIFVGTKEIVPFLPDNIARRSKQYLISGT